MKIISYNTYLAPTMPDRFYRRNLLLDKITEWHNGDIDIICLQEQNSHKTGCFSNIISKYWNNIFTDTVSIFEGFLFPFYTADNIQFIKDHIEDNDLKYFVYESPQPTYGCNTGLIILSKIKFNFDKAVNLPSDCVKSKGLLSVSNDEYQIINCHVTPTLQNDSLSTLIINLINKICCHDIEDIQKKSIDILNDNIDKDKKVILLGDFNISKNSNNYVYFMNTTNLYDTSTNENHVTIYKNCISPEQIDYIFTNDVSINKFEVINDCNVISDHYPIMCRN